MKAPAVGRFAPSPSGPLHFGSLVAALASWFHIRRLGGRWLVRIEDLDPPREVPGAADLILHQLEAHGLTWDGEVLRQSRRCARYEEILEALSQGGHTYPCSCSRTEVAAMGGRYDGRCRRRPPPEGPWAVRLHVPAELEVDFDDLYQGPQRGRPADPGGDFVVRRRDGLFSYQLAVVVDDLDQGVTHVVRGADLLESTPRQLWLFRLLGAEPPRYGHVAVAVNRFGQKLSKQNHAPSLDRAPPAANLRAALAFFGLVAPADLVSPEELLAWGLAHWHRAWVGGPPRPAPAAWADDGLAAPPASR
ncbi:MAG: glutamyl-Q tRNA(Asp) synthetase [Porticoccaceae bacterium]|nr:MAG: glutamyl-Q tRNA(Asp) synthetase [Porticoccaceae bacterium]